MKDRGKLIRGDVVWVNLGEHPVSHVHSGQRPCIVISTNKGNGHVYTVIPGSCKMENRQLPMHALIYPKESGCGLSRKTVFMAEQVTTVDKKQVLIKVGHIPEESDTWSRINDIIIRQLDMGV